MGASAAGCYPTSGNGVACGITPLLWLKVLSGICGVAGAGTLAFFHSANQRLSGMCGISGFGVLSTLR